MSVKINIYNLVLSVAILLMGSGNLSAQFYLTGQAPARAKWNQIKTPNYKIIYPQGIDSLAYRYASLLELERNRVMAGVKANPKPVPVVLNPYTVMSNGMVVWAPKRAEFYTLPPAMSDYYQNWERQLVLHESRHIGQMDHFTRGVYKPLNWIFGQQLTGLGVGLYGPKWLLEGDAVVAETELTDGGRGRSASFLEHYRASFLSGQYRNWWRWRFGSNKYYTPNAYALGYVLNATGRIKSDNYLYTGELLERYVKRFDNPNIINAASREVAGSTPRELFEEGVEMHSQMWSADYESRKPFTEAVALEHKKSPYYYEYDSPVVVGEDSVVCIRRGYDKATSLVLLCPDGKEKHLRPFSSSTSNLERVGQKLYWTESVVDGRWEKESYNILFCYDLKKGKVSRLSKRTSYNNPRASVTGDSLSVVEYPVGGGSNLVLLNASDGERLASYPAPENGQLTESVWLHGKLYALVVTEDGLGMYSMELASPGKWENVIAPQPKAIRSLASANGKLYFESDIDGVNNIYEFVPQTESLRRVVNSHFGSHSPHISGDRVYYSNLQVNSKEPVYSVMGSSAECGSAAPYVKEGKIHSTYKFEVADRLSQQAEEYFAAHPGADTDASIPMVEKRYRKGTHLFRFHSWAPVYYNADRIMSMSYENSYDMISLGATAYSQNTLGTAVTMLGYSYHKGFHAAHASFEYLGWTPVFKIAADYNTDHSCLYKIEEHENSLRQVVTPTGDPLLKISAQVYVPVNLSSKGWQRGLVPQVNWQFENNAHYRHKEDDYAYFQNLVFSLRYYQMRPVATAAIYPKWGFSATVSGAVSPYSGENFASTASFYSYFYLPGFARNHGLRLSAAYQEQFDEGKWMYLNNLVSMPRGHQNKYGTTYAKVTADYAIPVNFRGLNWGFPLYVRRLQIIPFADYAVLKSRILEKALYSYGCDLLIDANVFRIGVPVSFGVRYARTNDPDSPDHFGFLGSIPLF